MEGLQETSVSVLKKPKEGIQEIISSLEQLTGTTDETKKAFQNTFGNIEELLEGTDTQGLKDIEELKSSL
jgi:ABC-type transporter Mla subunit MlaD